VAEEYRLHPGYDVFHGTCCVCRGDYFVPPCPCRRGGPYLAGDACQPSDHFRHPSAPTEDQGIDVSLRLAMDYDVMLRLYKSGCLFHYIVRPLAAMRYGGASDAKNLEGLKEVRAIAIREGSPRLKAWFWFWYKVAISTIKNVLRSVGFYGLLRVHPGSGRIISDNETEVMKILIIANTGESLTGGGTYQTNVLRELAKRPYRQGLRVGCRSGRGVGYCPIAST